MTNSGGKVPIIECARAGYAFGRANLARLAPLGVVTALLAASAGVYFPLLPGGAPPTILIAPSLPLYLFFAPMIGPAAAAQGLPVGSGSLGLLLFLAAFAAAMAHLAMAHRLSAGDRAPGEPLGQAAFRLARGFASVSFVFAVYWLAVLIVVMTLFAAAVQAMGVTQAQLEAIGSDFPRMQEIGQQALATGPGQLVLWALGLSLVGLVFLLTRLTLFAPATVLEGRVLTFRTWGWTRGETVRIFAAGALVIVPLFLASFALGLVLAAGLGAAFGGGGASMAQLFGFNLGLALPMTLLATPAMVGLSAYLYRGLRPPEGAANPSSLG